MWIIFSLGVTALIMWRLRVVSKGVDNCIQTHRQLVRLQALERNPNRWIGGKVRKFSMASSQFLNPDRPSKEVEASAASHLKEGTTHNKKQVVHWPIAA